MNSDFREGEGLTKGTNSFNKFRKCGKFCLFSRRTSDIWRRIDVNIEVNISMLSNISGRSKSTGVGYNPGPLSSSPFTG